MKKNFLAILVSAIVFIFFSLPSVVARDSSSIGVDWRDSSITSLEDGLVSSRDEEAPKASLAVNLDKVFLEKFASPREMIPEKIFFWVFSVLIGYYLTRNWSKIIEKNRGVDGFLLAVAMLIIGGVLAYFVANNLELTFYKAIVSIVVVTAGILLFRARIMFIILLAFVYVLFTVLSLKTERYFLMDTIFLFFFLGVGIHLLKGLVFFVFKER